MKFAHRAKRVSLQATLQTYAPGTECLNLALYSTLTASAITYSQLGLKHRR